MACVLVARWFLLADAIHKDEFDGSRVDPPFRSGKDILQNNPVSIIYALG